MKNKNFILMKYILSIIALFSLSGCSASLKDGGFLAPAFCLILLFVSIYNWIKGKEHGDSGLKEFGIFGTIASALAFIVIIILMASDK